MREWSEQLERGARDDELLAVAARLERAGLDEPTVPSIEFRRQLRRDLLNQYETTADRPTGRLWRLAGSVTAIGVLAVIVIATWLSMSSAGRGSFGDAPNIGPAATALPPDGSRYTLLGYSVRGGIVTETMQADGGEEQTQSLLVPGMDIEVITHWSVPLDAGEATAFVHLLQGDDTLIAQSDAPLQAAAASDGQRAKTSLLLTIPADVAPGAYQLVSGLHDATSGAQLPFSVTITPGDEGIAGEVNRFFIGSYFVSAGGLSGLDVSDEVIIELMDEYESLIQLSKQDPSYTDAERAQLLSVYDALVEQLSRQNESQVIDGDSLVVRQVTPETGTLLTSDDRVDFLITIDYTLSSLPEAVVDARVATNEGMVGRGVGKTTATITRGQGTIELKISVSWDELTKPTDLGLWLQLMPDDDPKSPPILVAEMLGKRWRYEP